MSSPVVQQRLRRALPLALALYAGLPAFFCVAVAVIGLAASANDPDLAFNYQALLVPAAMLAISLLVWRKHRLRPESWSRAGLWLGSISLAVPAFYSTVLGIGWLAVSFLPAGAIGAAGGIQLGKLARRMLIWPPVPELAATPYPLSYPVRGRKGMSVVIDSGTLRIAESAGDLSTGPSYGLDTVREIRPVQLTGTEVLTFPQSIRNGPVSSPGQALAFRTPDAEWVVPIEYADAIGQIIGRRAALLSSPAEGHPGG